MLSNPILGGTSAPTGFLGSSQRATIKSFYHVSQSLSVKGLSRWGISRSGIDVHQRVSVLQQVCWVCLTCIAFCSLFFVFVCFYLYLLFVFLVVLGRCTPGELIVAIHVRVCLLAYYVCTRPLPRPYVVSEQLTGELAGQLLRHEYFLCLRG